MRSDARSLFEATTAATRRDWLLIAARDPRKRTMDNPPDRLAAILDLIQILDSLELPYALIGGVAVGIHSGAPRATADTDVAVRSTVTRSAAREALTNRGFRLVGEHAHSLNFRHPLGEPVQLAFDPSFDAMIDRAERFDLGGRTLRIVKKDDLIVMKERAAADPGRRRSKSLRDQADVALLRGDVPDPDEGW
ncbi:MAG: hypothetical protein HY270_19115 [Deltaproteobacteria bacterium]|nr:hypothetical protein [Deltaproteobacteria bacterium]